MKQGQKTTVRVGTHAVDQSYVQLYLGWNNINVSISYSAFGQNGSDLAFLVETVECQDNCNNFFMRVVGNYAWSRAGQVNTLSNTSIQYDPWGLSPVTLYLMGETGLSSAIGDKVPSRLF